MTSAPASIVDVYTFGSNSIDLLSLGGSVVAQKGSSGGAVIDDEGKLIGVIVTSTEENNTESRNLRAITYSYIDKAISQETGIELSALIGSSDLNVTASSFNEAISPTLKSLLIDSLDKITR